MTEPERAALEHIRQVVDSVIGVPDATEALPVDIHPSILPVPYFSPLVNELGEFTTDAGAAAGVMLVRAYGNTSITPEDLYHQTGQAADHPLSFTQIMNALGVNAIAVELRSNLKLVDLPLILFSGRPAITPIKQTILQQAGLAPGQFNGPYYVVVVGLDMKQVFIHDPLRADNAGQALRVPWLTFYQAWTQAEGYERAVLVPRQQLVRRVRVTSNVADVYKQPAGAEASLAGTANLGEVFEVTSQKGGWGKIGEDRWINLGHTTDI
jgi:hypothetical protein